MPETGEQRSGKETNPAAVDIGLTKRKYGPWRVLLHQSQECHQPPQSRRSSSLKEATLDGAEVVAEAKEEAEGVASLASIVAD